MKKALWMAVALALVACTTTEVQSPAGQSKPDLKEAARLNAQLGIDYMRKGQLDLALEKLEKAIDQDDDLAIAHSVIALVYQQKGESKLASKHYREALSLNSEDSVTLNNFGIFLCSQNEPEDAEEMFLRAANNKSNPVPADAWANAGVCLKNLPKARERAEGYLREALRLNPKHANALAQMAQYSYDKKDYLRSRAFLQRYESGSRATAQTLWIGAQTERALGDLATARSYERRLRSEFPESAEAEALSRKSGKP
ncbi:MAG: type IV pilus biogenesis/stability protein PilW [Gammaproteobacteria bacterium]